MAKMTTCILNNQPLDIDQAIDIKDSGRIPSPNFRCTECGQSVRPHKAGGNASAHFEHIERNPDCSLSHRIR